MMITPLSPRVFSGGMLARARAPQFGWKKGENYPRPEQYTLTVDDSYITNWDTMGSDDWQPEPSQKFLDRIINEVIRHGDVTKRGFLMVPLPRQGPHKKGFTYHTADRLRGAIFEALMTSGHCEEGSVWNPGQGVIFDGLKTNKNLHMDKGSTMKSIIFYPYQQVTGGFPKVADLHHALIDHSSLREKVFPPDDEETVRNQLYRIGRKFRFEDLGLDDYIHAVDMDVENTIPLFFFLDGNYEMLHGTTELTTTGDEPMRPINVNNVAITGFDPNYLPSYD